MQFVLIRQAALVVYVKVGMLAILTNCALRSRFLNVQKVVFVRVHTMPHAPMGTFAKTRDVSTYAAL